MAARKNLEQGMPIPKTAKRFWFECRREWTHVLRSPFVIALASGNLELDTFHNFVSQEQHIDICYTQVLQLVMPTRDHFLFKLENLDSLHNICGSDWTKEYPENIATVKYRDFLLATASGRVGVKLATPIEKMKIVFYTLAAMMPRIQMSAFIGKELQSLLNPYVSSHPYKFWINYYSSEYFQASTLKAEDLLDELGVSLTGEECDNMQKLYHHAMKLEFVFFSAQPMMQKTVVPLLKEHNRSKHHFMVFSDFDLTCTALDTSTILAEVAIERALKSNQVHSQNQIARMPSGDMRKTWDSLSEMHAEEYERCIENIIFRGAAENFDYTVLRKALEQLSGIEERANARVIASGLLKGLNHEDIKCAGECLFLQDGCISFFQSITKNKNISSSIYVLSHCWCSDLIMSVFSSGNMDEDDVDIHANELTYEKPIYTGDIVWNIVTPIDKADCFWKIRLHRRCDKREKMIVYIGDSVDDLLCLVQADIGIVINASESLKKVASRFGVSLVQLFDALVEKQKEMVEEGSSCNWKGGLSGILYTVSSWAEIHSFILGSYT